MARIFDDWLAAYIDYTANTEAPARYHFWVGVSTVAGALRRRVWIDQLKFQWTPNFYIILVGPAGVVTKSTTLNSGTGILERVKGIVFGPNSLTWQALGESLQNAQEVFEHNGEKYVIACETIAVSEAGTLLKLEDDGLVSLLIDMWDGQKSIRPWKHQTRSQKTIEINNPWLNIICCTTPTWLRGNFPEQLVGGGLTSRIIFVYADKKSKIITYPRREWTRSGISMQQYNELRDALAHDLTEISQLAGEFTMEEEAMDWGEIWHRKALEIRPPALASSRFDSYIARKQTHLHKIAIVLAAARKDCKMVITKEHLERASIVLDDVEGDMLKVFESIGLVQEAQQRSEIIQFLRVRGGMTVEELWTLCCNIMPMRDFKEGVKAAIEAEIIEQYPVAPPSRFGVRMK